MMKSDGLRKVRIDTDPQDSDQSGMLGLYEIGFRRFKSLSTLLTLLPMYVLASVCLGMALTPAVWLFQWGYSFVSESSSLWRGFVASWLFAFGYFVFGMCLLLVIPLFNLLLNARPKPWRGPYYSSRTVQWGVHNGLTYLARYLFLEFATPTPLNVMFYRLMGMKIGRGSQVNTTNISDPSLISIGDKTTIGGSATICAHYGQGGYLVIAPVKIGNGVTVGLRAIIMGGVEIGDNAKILPNSSVLPKTVIPPGELWGGIPARRIDS
jgi:hypothetical protein